MTGSRSIAVRGQKRKYLGMKDMLVILIVVMVAQEHTYVETHQTAHFKYVQFIVDQYLNKVFLKGKI